MRSGRSLTANARLHYPPGTRYSVHGVLAGAYRGRDVSQRATLTHAIIVGEDKSLCRRIEAGRLAGYSDSPDPTCPECASRLARLREAMVYDAEIYF